MRTIFEGMRNMPIKNYSRLCLKLNSYLKEMGFERVNYQDRINLNTFYNKLTLMINPSLDLEDDRNAGDNYTITTKLVSSTNESDWKLIFDYLGHRRSYFGTNNYRYIIRTKEEVIPIIAKTKNDVDVRIGDYFKERNIVALYVNIFNSDLSDSDNQMIFPILDDVKKSLEGKITKADVSDKMKLAMLNTFREEIENKISNVESQTKNTENVLNENRKNLIVNLKSLNISKKELEMLKSFSLNIDTTLKEQIEEVKKLKFVKNVRLTTKGIKMNLGKIYIKQGESNLYIGEFNLTITPENVKVECVNPVKEKDNIYVHPHVNGNDNCYGGERSLKIEEYLACFELKKLVYFIYLFLKSYNPDDCFNKIRYWEGTPERVNKEVIEIEKDFDDDWQGDETREIREDDSDNDSNEEDNDEDDNICPDCGEPYDDCTCDR